MSVCTKNIIKKLSALGDGDIAIQSQRFFKTGKGEYGEGDRFLGIRVPTLRKCAREFHNVPLEDTLELLTSAYHEVRHLALLIMIAKFTSTASEQKVIYHSYLKSTPFINNWDLVDCSAEHIVGAYLYDRSRKPLYGLAKSRSLWERRISVMSTFHFIKKDDFSDTLSIAERLLHDPEDLIHKAVGWMLREVGKRDLNAEEKFLKAHYRTMPRTMLRYAIEKLPEAERQAYLNGTR